MLQHRLSPSGTYLTAFPWLQAGDVITNVYKGFFPRGNIGGGMLIPDNGAAIVETFSIPLPTTFPNSGDPPIPFDPANLMYLIWVNSIANTDIAQSPTPGPFNMTTYISVDGPAGPVDIENVVVDETSPIAFSNLAGEFYGRSSVHAVPPAEVDILDYTSLAVFRPGTIPAWTDPATPWVAGQTRHIYVRVSQDSETGEPYMPNHRSNIVIVELYGSVRETIGVSSLYPVP
jgi:hypothetical protein